MTRLSGQTVFFKGVRDCGSEKIGNGNQPTLVHGRISCGQSWSCGLFDGRRFFDRSRSGEERLGKFGR
jgi:hypothetical protein